MPGDSFCERVALALRQTQRQMATIIGDSRDRSLTVLMMVYSTVVIVFVIATMPDQPNEFVYFRDMIVFVTLCYAAIGLVLLLSAILLAVYIFLSYFFESPID